MASDDGVRLALEALAAPLERFRGAMAATLEQARVQVASQRARSDGRGQELLRELGPFAAGRIDVERLTALIPSPVVLEAAAAARVRQAAAVLRDLRARGDGLFTARADASEGLRNGVAAALAEVGRAFGAARVIEGVRRDRHADPGEHDHGLASLPFAEWSRAERRCAPPLVVTVDGSVLWAGGLAEFLDGSLKIVLVVHGESPPAPLVRLITPGTFVMQTSYGPGSGLDRLASWEGPGIAALLPDGAARFVHDPSLGSAPWERLRIEYAPETSPRRAIGGQSPAQQMQELAQLMALAAPPPAPPLVVAPASGAPAAASPAATAPPPLPAAAVEQPPDAVDKLTAWLLSQADLSFPA